MNIRVADIMLLALWTAVFTVVICVSLQQAGFNIGMIGISLIVGLAVLLYDPVAGFFNHKKR